MDLRRCPRKPTVLPFSLLSVQCPQNGPRGLGKAAKQAHYPLPKVGGTPPTDAGDLSMSPSSIFRCNPTHPNSTRSRLNYVLLPLLLGGTSERPARCCTATANEVPWHLVGSMWHAHSLGGGNSASTRGTYTLGPPKGSSLSRVLTPTSTKAGANPPIPLLVGCLSPSTGEADPTRAKWSDMAVEHNGMRPHMELMARETSPEGGSWPDWAKGPWRMARPLGAWCQ